jgi:hypothetical protein
VAISLATSNRTITATNDITVSDAVTWTPADPGTERRNDVRINAAITASTAGSRLLLVAETTCGVNGALTASALGSLIDLNAGHDVVLNEAITASGGGAVVLRADIDGTGGPAGARSA